MNRRSFMKWLGIGAGTVAAAPVLAGYVEPAAHGVPQIDGDILYIDQYHAFAREVLVTTCACETCSWR